MALGPVIPPAEALPGMPRRPLAPVPAVNLRERMAFGAVPKYFADREETGGFDETASADVTSTNLERVVLLGKGKFVVDHLALDVSEYRRVVRSPRGFVVNLGAVSVASSDKKMDTNVDRVSEKEKVDTLDGITAKGVVHNTMIAATETEIANLTTLLGYIAEPGRAMATGEDIISLAAQARDVYFTRLLRVVRHAQEWNDKRFVAAKSAMDYRLTQGPQNERMQYWRELADLSKKYATARKLLFEDRRDKLRILWYETNAPATPQGEVEGAEDAAATASGVQ